MRSRTSHLTWELEREHEFTNMLTPYRYTDLVGVVRPAAALGVDRPAAERMREP